MFPLVYPWADVRHGALQREARKMVIAFFAAKRAFCTPLVLRVPWLRCQTVFLRCWRQVKFYGFRLEEGFGTGCDSDPYCSYDSYDSNV